MVELESDLEIKRSLTSRAFDALNTALEAVKKQLRFNDRQLVGLRAGLSDVIDGKVNYSFLSAKPEVLATLMKTFKSTLENSKSSAEFDAKVELQLSGNKLFFRSKEYAKREAEAKAREAARAKEDQAKKTVPTKISAEGLGPEAKKLAAAFSAATTGIPLHPTTLKAIDTFLEAYDKYLESVRETGVAGKQDLRFPFKSSDVAAKFFSALAAELRKANIAFVSAADWVRLKDDEKAKANFVISEPVKVKDAYLVVLVLPEKKKAIEYEEHVVEGQKKKK